MISIIIPTCNRNDLLRKCLYELNPEIQFVSSNLYEVIVTDDSKDGIAMNVIQASYAWVKWVKGPTKGPAANRNNGAKHAKGEWLLFIDDDCIPGNRLLREYLKAIEDYKGIEVFEGFIGVDRAKRSFIEESPINETGGLLWSCNFMISKRLFEALNGFDINFPYTAMEDVDLRYRIKKLNKQIKFLNNAQVMHPWRAEKKLLGKKKREFNSILYFIKKHPEMSKKIDSVYFFRTGLNNIKRLFQYSIKYRFRGFGTQIQLIFLYMYFSLALQFTRREKTMLTQNE